MSLYREALTEHRGPDTPFVTHPAGDTYTAATELAARRLGRMVFPERMTAHILLDYTQLPLNDAAALRRLLMEDPTLRAIYELGRAEGRREERERRAAG